MSNRDVNLSLVISARSIWLTDVYSLFLKPEESYTAQRRLKSIHFLTTYSDFAKHGRIKSRTHSRALLYQQKARWNSSQYVVLSNCRKNFHSLLPSNAWCLFLDSSLIHNTTLTDRDGTRHVIDSPVFVLISKCWLEISFARFHPETTSSRVFHLQYIDNNLTTLMKYHFEQCLNGML